jgi:hypothetical protein
MKKHKYSEEQLIQRTGKSKAYLWGRMKLLELAAVSDEGAQGRHVAGRARRADRARRLEAAGAADEGGARH